MKAFSVQRSSAGCGHAVSIQEDLYVPELGVSFYAITEDLMEKPVIGKASHSEMSQGMFKDLTEVSKGKIPQKSLYKRSSYGIFVRGETDLSSSDIESLEKGIIRYRNLKNQLAHNKNDEASNKAKKELEEITDRLFDTITGKSPAFL